MSCKHEGNHALLCGKYDATKPMMALRLSLYRICQDEASACEEYRSTELKPNTGKMMV